MDNQAVCPPPISAVNTGKWEVAVLVVVVSAASCTVLCSVYAEMLNRRQNRLQLVVFGVDCFVVNEDAGEDMMEDASTHAPGSVWLVQDETASHWVNVSICLPVFIHSLWPPYGIGQAIIFLPCDFYLSSSSSFFPCLIWDWTSTILRHIVWP